MAEAELVEVAQKGRGQAPPPWVVWEALAEPFADSGRPWLEQLREDELAPVVLSVEKPSEVVWASLWPEYPQVRIRFSIESDRGGSKVRWSLMAPPGLMADADVERLRHRINFLINDLSGLRGLFGQ
jgi:hypothetical protein